MVEYVANYSYISTELCVNKAKPKLNCNGKCYLSKELSKTNDGDNHPFSKGKNSPKSLLDFYVFSEITSIIKGENKISNFILPIISKDYSFLLVPNIFRPPIFLA